ncbi:hypothetical protein [Stenomitos frigidus]|uniref:hypothetical protein n=1 Tax=Stenomitos frigidus TaxID=1886765 RepID=UPI0011B259CE|nr:hypothetical protein [Stenomitos frigidus]
MRYPDALIAHPSLQPQPRDRGQICRMLARSASWQNQRTGRNIELVDRGGTAKRSLSLHKPTKAKFSSP